MEGLWGCAGVTFSVARRFRGWSFMSRMSHWSPSVRMKTYRRATPPSPPSDRPFSTATTSSSSHFSILVTPESQMLTSPAPYSPRGMLALERRVLERVVLCLHSESVHSLSERWPLRHGPGHEHVVVLESCVEVQRGRVVLLDHEDRVPSGGGGSSRPGRARGVRGTDLVWCGTSAAGRGPRPCGGRRRALLGLDRERQWGERVGAVLDALQHVVHRELAEVRVLELLPRPAGPRRSGWPVRAASTGTPSSSTRCSDSSR